MKKIFVMVFVIFFGLLFILVSGETERMKDINYVNLNAKKMEIQPTGKLKPDLDFGKFPLYFIFNKGQVNKKALFYVKASRYTLWITKQGLVFDSHKPVDDGIKRKRDKFRHLDPDFEYLLYFCLNQYV